jgi:NitT/TauT family transport system permease protein
MSDVVRNIPESRYDDAKTLKMGEWLSIWYVVVRGTVAEAIDTVRGNAAMGWAMLMFVEGLVRSEGGVGVELINMEKHVEWASLWALVLIILMVGLIQDWLIGQVRKVACPYAS